MFLINNLQLICLFERLKLGLKGAFSFNLPGVVPSGKDNTEKSLKRLYSRGGLLGAGVRPVFFLSRTVKGFLKLSDQVLQVFPISLSRCLV